MRIIKSTTLIFIAVTIVFAGSCGRNSITSRDSKPMSEKVLKYLDTDDVEGLKSMFSEKTIAQTPDLDEKIEVAMHIYIGRNSLFSDTPRGAFASTAIYILIELAEENGLKPYVYLQHLLSRMPDMDFTYNPGKLESLLRGQLICLNIAGCQQIPRKIRRKIDP